MSTESVSSASRAAAVTPSDSVDIAFLPRALYIGTTGDVTADVGGTTVLFKNVPSGYILFIKASRVRATGTTATNIVALA
jgi:hypothetical protein